MTVQGPEKQVDGPAAAEIPTVVMPKKPEKISVKQIDAMKEHRRRGMEVQAIALIMGLSDSVVSRFTKDIRPERKPEPNNGGETTRPPIVQSLSKSDGQQVPVPRDSPLILGPALNNPEIQLYFLMMAGDAVRLGYRSLPKYFEDTIGWLAAITEVRKLVGVDNPQQFIDQLKVLITKAQSFERMVSNARSIGGQMSGSRD